MPAQEYLELLCTLNHRRSTTENERKAAELIKEEFTKLNLPTIVEKFRFQPSFSWVHFLHYLSIFSASIISLHFPLLAIILAIITIISTYGEFTTKFYLFRRLVPTRTSQNILAKLVPESINQEMENKKAKKRVILVAHYDTTKSAIIFHPKLINFLAASENRQNPPYMELPFLIMVLLLLIFVFRFFTLKGVYLDLGQIFLSVFILIGILIMLEREIRGKLIQGASDNGTGTAIVLSLAKKLSQNPPNNIEIWFLTTGCEEPHMGGMLAFLKKHQGELDKENTYFINIDSVGGGCLKYAVGEGPLKIFKYHPELIKLTEEIIAEDAEFKDLRKVLLPAATDALISTVRGFKSITFIALNEKNVSPNYHWITDTIENIDFTLLPKCENLIEKLIKKIS